MASRGVNRVIIIGNLGQDPEVKFMPNGNAVANFTVATSETWKDKQNGEQKEKTEWHRVVMYQRLAEIAGEYLTKGSKVYLDGKLQTRKWQNQQGVDQYTTEVVVNDIQMLDNRTTAEHKAQSQPAQQDSNQQGYNQTQHNDDFQRAQMNHQQQQQRPNQQAQGGYNPQEPGVEFNDDPAF